MPRMRTTVAALGVAGATAVSGIAVSGMAVAAPASAAPRAAAPTMACSAHWGTNAKQRGSNWSAEPDKAILTEPPKVTC